MRRLVVALIAASLALTLSGCSSGGSTPAATPAPVPPAAVPQAGATGADTGIADRSVNETTTTTFAPFPTTAGLPADLKQKITVDKQPTIIYFFDSSQNTSTEVRKLIDSVRTENRGMVDLVAYDIGKYITAAPDGTVSIDQPAFSEATATKEAVLLARDPAIGVTLTPFIVITDGQGYMIYKHRGLIDRAFLEREVQRAAK